MFKPQVYKNRRNRLREKINSGIILILGNSESQMNYPDNTYHFRQDSNFSYFFGLDLPDFAGVLDVDNNKDYIFANDVDIDDIIWMGPQPSVKDLAAKVDVDNTAEFNKLYDFLSDAISKGRKIHFTPPYRGNNKILLEKLLGISPSKIRFYASLELIKAIISLREIKEECEILEIEKACNIGYEMHVAAMKMAKPGVYEREIAGYIEGIALSGGGMLSFPVILTQHGETLHNHYHGNKLLKGNLMLTDAGCETESHYASDNTRTVPVGGIFSQKQKDIYNIVLKANTDVIPMMKPGVKYFDIHMQACRIITQGLQDLGIMKGNIEDSLANGAHAMFMPHGLGHMMGLDVHDMEDLGQIYVGYDEKIRPVDQFGTAYLRLGKELKPGFVLTDEPGCYFIPELIDKWYKEGINKEFINFDKVNEYRDFGGIRIEDDILITETGSKILGKPIPKTVEDIENLMK
ncbi:MAG: aminopeptidase P family protein [Bacteroidales bacterium]|nr:aminopeptidase P family protein [Bacteroidales bacterium]